MLKNYVKIALRNLKRRRGYAFLNITGLAIGMACCLLLLLYVQDELSYDRFHDEADQIYRLIEVGTFDEIEEESAGIPFPVAPALRNDFPDITTTRFFRMQSQVPLVGNGQQRFYEERFFWADSNVFDVFSFPFLQGDPGTALDDPYALVITEATAEKYFGTRDVVGRILTLEGTHAYTITGVLENLPPNVHFSFDFLASFESLNQVLPGVGVPEGWFTGWYWNPCFTYVRLPDEYDARHLENQLPTFVDKYYPDWFKADIDYYLQPLTAIHLYSNVDQEIETNSDILYIYVLSAVALFILLIACINYMNLATAWSFRRAQEVGMRKALGANRKQLIMQFLGESVLLTFLALLVALTLVELVMPVFNAFTGKAMSIDYTNAWLTAGAVGLALLVGTLSGSYPAFYLAAFEPARVLKGAAQTTTKAVLLRKGLVTMQFSIAIILMISTVTVFNQADYLVSRTLGFDRQHVVVTSIRGTSVQERIETFKQEALRDARVEGITVSWTVPGKGGIIAPIQAEGQPQDAALQWPTLSVDHSFIQTMGLELVAGRGFSRTMATDTIDAYILNETAARRLGWADPIGKRLGLGADDDDLDGQVIGVVKDFNYASLRQRVEPLVIRFDPDLFSHMLVRIEPADVRGSLAALEATWKQFEPQRPFEFTFLDQSLRALYNNEHTLKTILLPFAFIAIFVACLGLFGLAAFTTEQRTKEIGIRKVFGASLGSIVALLSKDFLKLVGIAFLIATPMAYFAIQQWLNGFAYRIEVGAGTFLLAGTSAFLIALGTVSYRTVKAALANPIKSLRYE